MVLEYDRGGGGGGGRRVPGAGGAMDLFNVTTETQVIRKGFLILIVEF
ncbi:MAG: hypothetical protein IPH89_08055 [Bacteroidetes bacterium]|nr:hypothetical protein [Bacteroidota bacterium]